MLSLTEGHPTWFPVSLSIPCSIHACPDNIPIFFPSGQRPFPHSRGFVLPLLPFHELLAHLCRSHATFAQFLSLRDAPILNLEEVVLEWQPALLVPLAFQSSNPWNASMYVCEEVKVSSPEVQSSNPTYCFVLFIPLKMLNSTVSWSLHPKLPQLFVWDHKLQVNVTC